MRNIIDRDVDTLRNRLHGSASLPGDKDYDQTRSLWNGDIDNRPALIARCQDAQDVATAIRFGRDRNLELSVRGGGHSFSGASVCDGGLMIDLSQQTTVTTDPAAHRARCGGGTTLAALDAATQQHAQAVPAGTVSHTGVAGLTLGGGFGWLTRKAGLTCDNLLGAEVVTAGGDILTVNAQEHPDMFWAIRGGGGNFGVVTNFEFQTHDVGPEVQIGLFFWSADQGREALRLMNEVGTSMPNDMGALMAGMNAPPAPFVPPAYHFAPGYALLVAGFGSADEHARLFDDMRAVLPPLFELVSPIPYAGLQQLLDDTAPWGALAYEKAHYLEGLSSGVIDVIMKQMPRKTSPVSFTPMFNLGGAYAAVGEDDTAFGGGRSINMVFNITAMAQTADTLQADRVWARRFWQDLIPYATGGAYINFMSEYDESRVRATFGPKYDRLARIKAQYDPDNVFHRGINIKPQP